MLTKSDFDQIGKAVRKIVREEVETEVSDAKKTLESQIRLSKLEIKSVISDVDDRVKNVEVTVSTLEKDMKKAKKDLSYIKKTVDLIVKNYDEGDVLLGKRVTKIEKHLGISNSN